MATVLKATGVQYPMTAVFEVNYNDSMVNTSGDSVAFGTLTSGANTTYDIFTPPINSMVIGGRVIVLTAFATSSANTVDLGDSDDADRYTETGAIDLQDPDAPASGVELLGDGKIYDGNQKVRMTITNGTVDATAGRAVIVLTMIALGRQNENLKTT